MAMQRFTFKISFQEGRRLGFILIDSDVYPEIDPDSYYESPDDWDDDDDDIVSIRGGGSTIEIGNSSDDDDDVAPQVWAGGGFSLQKDFAAEAAAAGIAAQGGNIPPPVNHKRKRPTKVCISINSLVFKMAEHLRKHHSRHIASDKKPGQSPDKKNLDANCARPNVDSSDVDSLIAWGRENNLPPIKFRNGDIPLETLNNQVLKLVLTGAVQKGDIIEKVQYTRQYTPSVVKEKMLTAKQKTKAYRRKRRCRPYFRSDHYTSVQCENKLSTDVANILRCPQNYPLYITLKRHTIPVYNIEDSARLTNGLNSPPRKRLKIEPKTGPASNGAKDEVICLLDSSDEEEEPENKDATQVKGGNAKARASSPPQDRKDIKSLSSLPQLVPPDPQQMPLYDDDFVLTPYGAGKIVSTRVERYASLDNNSDATVFKPTIIYSIDLQFGICHIPAKHVKPISGTSYTEKTLITYQRVPITGHDLLRLRPMTYLNDSIINFYLKYVRSQYELKNKPKVLAQKKDGRGWDDLDGEGIHIFPSFCYTRIKNIMGPATRNSKAVRTKIWKDLKSWTKGTDIFKKKFLVFPINEHLHWTCVFVCHPGRLVRRQAKDLQGKKESAIRVEDRTNVTATHPKTNIPHIKKESSVVSTAGPGDDKMVCEKENAIRVDEITTVTDVSQSTTHSKTDIADNKMESSIDSSASLNDGMASKGHNGDNCSQMVSSQSKGNAGDLSNAIAYESQVTTGSLTIENSVEDRATNTDVSHSTTHPETGIPTSKKDPSITGSAGSDANMVCEKETAIKADGREAVIDESRSNTHPKTDIPSSKKGSSNDGSVGPGDSMVCEKEAAIKEDGRKAVIDESNSTDHPETDIPCSKRGSDNDGSVGPGDSMVCEKGTAIKVDDRVNVTDKSPSTANPKTDIPCSKRESFNCSTGAGDSMICEKETAINLDDRTSVTDESTSTTKPQSGLISSKEKHSNAVPIDNLVTNLSDGKICSQKEAKDSAGAPENQLQKNETRVTNEMSATGAAAAAPKQKIKWQCDFCETARFDTFEEAVEHEKRCDNNVEWCMIHFDSGKHFKLHKMTEITGNIRKYLNAYYEAEYGSSHPGLSSFTTKNMPGFAAAVPQQDNTKDCGVYMLENAQRFIENSPVVDSKFVQSKGATKKSFFGSLTYDKYVIEKKRDDILQLIQTMHRGENEID